MLFELEVLSGSFILFLMSFRKIDTLFCYLMILGFLILLGRLVL